MQSSTQLEMIAIGWFLLATQTKDNTRILCTAMGLIKLTGSVVLLWF